jgi:hypothetical protein
MITLSLNQKINLKSKYLRKGINPITMDIGNIIFWSNILYGYMPMTDIVSSPFFIKNHLITSEKIIQCRNRKLHKSKHPDKLYCH